MSVAVPVLVSPEAHERPEESSLTRDELVWPGMCGHNSLFVGQIGDWTWDAVNRLCGTDVLRARNPTGEPTYLSFYYFRVRGSARFHLRTPTFGDRLRVTTRLYNVGSEAVHALHRIERSSAGATAGHGVDPWPLAAEDFYESADPNCLFVENFNRWISRAEPGSNRRLVRSSPADFTSRHLPALPAAFSPRAACHRARTRLTFRGEEGSYVGEGPTHHAEYRVDITRDLNGVGMLYFASYFSIVDWALLQWWRRAGRTDASFLGRVVVDQELCFVGNADADCVVAADVQAWVCSDDPGTESIDIVLRDRDGGRLLAVCTIRVLRPTM